MANQSMINKNAEYGNISHQYVGARYVPKFFQNTQGTAEWVANVPYEPLTIVTYLGNSYTSKIPVPSGIGSPNNNPTYWALTGNYNSQLEDILTNLSNLSIEVSENKNNIDEINYVLDYNNISSEGICVWIGDSYVGAASLNDIPSPLTNRFSHLVSNSLKMVEKNYAIGGTGFITGTPNFSQQLDTAKSDLAQNLTDVKYVFICGGRNDNGNSYSSISNATASTINKAQSYFPNAKLILIPLLWDWKNVTHNIMEVHGAIVDGSLRGSQNNNYNICVIDNAYTWFIGLPNLILWQNGADVHYNVAGHQKAAKMILSSIYGGDTIGRHYQHSFNNNQVSGKTFIEIVDDSLIISGYFSSNTGIQTNFNLVNDTTNGVNLSYFLGATEWLPILIQDRTNPTTPIVGGLLGTFVRTGETTGQNTFTLRLTQGSAGVDLVQANHNYYYYAQFPYGFRPTFNWT